MVQLSPTPSFVQLTGSFRARCEALTTKLRADLGLRAIDPLPADRLAAHLAAQILVPGDLTNLDAQHIATLEESTRWCGALINRDPATIVLSPSQSHARRESTLMHELAHLLLQHPLAVWNPEKGIWEQPGKAYEKEAQYLGGCLQISQRALQWASDQKMSLEQTAAYFGASQEMVIYRVTIRRMRRNFGLL